MTTLPKTPAKGMRDFLPEEFALRQRVLNQIQSVYERYGFSRIETPAVENISLLTSKQGGDNEKLIFKILKRGEKLENAQDELCDLGLRYDLTVPLARFYANNAARLPSVFKAMQMDNVWRADRPQRGRFRQFVQCDIDIIGEETNLAEIELISATTKALDELGFDNLTVRISDRRLLSAIADFCGFSEEERNCVFIALDKLDKIGFEGVSEELGVISKDKSDKFIGLIQKITSSANPFEQCASELGEFMPQNVAQNLRDIMYVCGHMLTNGKIVFDVTLVRGMGYYTGTIYEISVDGLNSSVAGGGRYDKMIGKIIGTDVPACGFSIGFERIVLLLSERGVNYCNKERAAVILDKNISAEDLLSAEEKCAELRKLFDVSVVKKNNNFGFQLKQLKDCGYNILYRYKNGETEKID